MTTERILELLRPVAETIAREATETARKELLSLLSDDRPTTVARRSSPPHCLFPSCTTRHRGPKSSYLCAEHKDTPKKERAKLLKSWKES